MAKIVNMTRTEMTQLPFNENEAHTAVRALYEADIGPAMFSQLLEFIRNNSGVRSFVNTLSAKPEKVSK